MCGTCMAASACARVSVRVCVNVCKCMCLCMPKVGCSAEYEKDNDAAVLKGEMKKMRRNEGAILCVCGANTELWCDCGGLL